MGNMKEWTLSPGDLVWGGETGCHGELDRVDLGQARGRRADRPADNANATGEM